MHTLADHVQEHGPLAVRDAIGWVARAGMAVAKLHAEGRTHGRLSPRAIFIAEPDCQGKGALRDPSTLEDDPLYHSPERVEDDKPTGFDDVWALTATLYWTLTRALPYPGGVAEHLQRRGGRRAPAAIATHRADLDVLQRLVDRVMAPRHPLPAQSIEQLLDELRELSPTIDGLPPLDIVARKQRGLAMLSGFRPHALALLALTVALALVAWWKSRAPAAEHDAPPDPAPKRTAGAPPSAAPLTSASTAASAPPGEAEDLVECTVGLFAADAFEKQRVALDFPCRERNPGKGVAHMSRAILRGANGRDNTARSEWGQLGWYRLAAFAIARAECCRAPEPLILPTNIARCKLTEALDEITTAARGADRSLIMAVEHVSRAFDCAHQMDVGPMFGVDGPPNAGQMALFLRALNRMRSAPR